MTRSKRPSTSRRAVEATKFMRQGRDFMRLRQDYVQSSMCLPGMIMACIAEGARTRDEIIRNVPRFVGHSYAEVAATLDAMEGAPAADGYWYRGEDKIYRLYVTPEDREDTVYLKLGQRKRKQALERDETY